MITNYCVAYIYTKCTDLLPWFDNRYSRELAADYHRRSVGFNQLRQSYATVRDVNLVLLVRYENDKCYCKIKCPINPMPVKGEFEAPSLACVDRFLQREGWKLDRKLPVNLLK